VTFTENVSIYRNDWNLYPNDVTERFIWVAVYCQVYTLLYHYYHINIDRDFHTDIKQISQRDN